MSKIKNFFSRKKEEAAFKLKIGGSLGHGHSLNEQYPETSSNRKSMNDAYNPPKRKELSEEVRAAAAAALARVEKKDSKEFNTSLAAIKAQAKKELEEERKLKEFIPADMVGDNKTCEGVCYRCPIISEEILSEKEWKVKIKEFLYQQQDTEKGLTSCLIIQNCNSKEKADECISTLKKYLENLIKFPDEEKYYKIRMSNRIFCEKVRYVEGALDFLQAAGFSDVVLDNEQFLIWSKENVEKDYELSMLLEALQNSEPIQLILDRNIKVLMPSQAKPIVLADDFYRISPEEIKREQRLRAEAIESTQILKTKAMREREEQRTLRMYKYSLIRVKLPDGILIQGTFSVYEKLSDIFEFVQSCLRDETIEFSLATSSEGKLTDDDKDKTLYDLNHIRAKLPADSGIVSISWLCSHLGANCDSSVSTTAP
ncbi:GDI interacting protein 3 isoform 2-T3 [Cochliomyia hominivorax]